MLHATQLTIYVCNYILRLYSYFRIDMNVANICHWELMS